MHYILIVQKFLTKKTESKHTFCFSAKFNAMIRAYE